MQLKGLHILPNTWMGPSSLGPSKAYPGLSNFKVSVLNQLVLTTDSVLVVLGFVAIVFSWLLSWRLHVTVITNKKSFLYLWLATLIHKFKNLESLSLRIVINLYGIMLFPLQLMLNFKGNSIILYKFLRKFLSLWSQVKEPSRKVRLVFNSGFLVQLSGR